MNVSRVNYLFPITDERSEVDRLRLVTILTACCQAAKNRYADRAPDDDAQSLTHESNAFSIDEVYENLPQVGDKPAYTIVELLATLADIACDGYIEDESGERAIIRLTDNLFEAIAEEWAYAKGTSAHRIDGDRVFAPSLTMALAIAERRLKRMKKEVSHA